MGKRQKLRRGFWWRGDKIQARDPVTGQRSSSGFSDPAAAYAWHAERQRLAANPAYAASTQATVGRWVVKTLEHKAAQRSAGTLHMYRTKLGHFVRIFGADRPLSYFDNPGVIDDYITTRTTEGVVNNTIARELTCFFQLLRLAKRAKEFAGDLEALMPVDFSAQYKPVKRVLELRDVPRLMAALRNDTERAWVAFALCFAADHGDVERALPSDWDPSKGTMFVRGTKTDTRSADLPVLPHVRDLFEFALPRLPVSWPRSSKGLGEACKRAGLPHLSPKDLRRSACTWLIEVGADDSFVSRFMRHSSDAMVRMVYGQVRPAALGSNLQEPALRLLAARSEAITVAGETVEDSTDESQSEDGDESNEESEEKQAWPLGGMADAGDLKGDTGRPRNSGHRGNTDEPPNPNVTSRCDVSRTVAKLGTFPSQRTDSDTETLAEPAPPCADPRRHAGESPTAERHPGKARTLGFTQAATDALALEGTRPEGSTGAGTRGVAYVELTRVEAGTYSPSAWALALAAEQLGLGGAS